MSDEEQSRSERLRQRRSNREDSQPVEESAADSTPTDNERSATSVKEEQVGTYMYLPESQKKEVERLYNLLKAEYEYEFDEEFEKNRHFFPLVVQYGLDSLDGLDAQDVRTRLTNL